MGRVGGKQTTSLGRGCAHHSIIVHELGHIVGFWHEQNRPDRDNYVDVLWDNIVTSEYRHSVATIIKWYSRLKITARACIANKG